MLPSFEDLPNKVHAICHVSPIGIKSGCASNSLEIPLNLKREQHISRHASGCIRTVPQMPNTPSPWLGPCGSSASSLITRCVYSERAVTVP